MLMLVGCWRGLPTPPEVRFVYVRPSPVPDTCPAMLELAKGRPNSLSIGVPCFSLSFDDNVWCNMQAYFREVVRLSACGPRRAGLLGRVGIVTPVLCRCGCGGRLPVDPMKTGRRRVYIPDHAPNSQYAKRAAYRKRAQEPRLVTCACGCELQFDRNGVAGQSPLYRRTQR